VKCFSLIFLLLFSFDALGAVISNEKATNVRNITPTVSAVTVDSATNVTSATCSWYRDSKFMIGECVVLWGGAGSGSPFTVTIPDSKVMDTDFLAGGTATGNAGASILGAAVWFDSGNTTFDGMVQYASTTTMSFLIGPAPLAGSVFADNDGLKFNFKAPIVGW